MIGYWHHTIYRLSVCDAYILYTAKVSEQINRNYPDHDFTAFNPLHRPYPLKHPTHKISKYYLFIIISCFVDHMTILFYVDVNCENRSLVAEYCYRGDDWRTIGYFSATAALLVPNSEVKLLV